MKITTKLAVIDLGSNSIRLRIEGLAHDGQHEMLKYEKRYIRLSQNMGAKKRLQKEPMQRAIDALKEFRQIIESYQPVQLIAVATAAVRQAENQQAFVDRVLKETGIKLNVISGRREAYLDYVGVTRTLDLSDGLIVDTGGGSTELILVDDGAAEETISIPMGSVLISQTYHLGDKVAAADLYDAMVDTDFRLANLNWLSRARGTRVVALGGSNRALAKMYRRIGKSDKADLPSLQGLTMHTNQVFSLVHSLLTMDREERAKVPGIAPERADVIIGGLLPLTALMRQLKLDELTFCNHGLRDGIIFKYMDHELKQETIQQVGK